MEKELKNLDLLEIKKVTPYLDDIEPRLTPKQRKFCWYYCTNGFNGADACRKAGYKVRKGKKRNENIYLAGMANENLNKPYIRESLKRIINNLVSIDKNSLEKRLLDDWIIIATTSPDMLIDEKGAPKFKKWEDIPQELRKCVEGIETKYYGKDANREVITLKLADPKWYKDRLAKYIQMANDTLNITGDVNIIMHVNRKIDNEEKE